MVPERDLTDDEKKTLLEDFARWSGGFAPGEMDSSDLHIYCEYTLSMELPNRAAREFLHDEAAKSS